MPPNPQNLIRWKAGESGNPYGAGVHAQRLAAYVRSLGGGSTGKVYLDALHAIATSPHQDRKARITALGMLLDRGWGKAKETISLEASVSSTVTPEVLSRLSDADLAAVVDAGLRLRAALGVAATSSAPDDEVVM